MAEIFDTADLNEQSFRTLSPDEVSWVYNGLDVGVTASVFNELNSQLADEPENVKETYENALAKLAPIMEMSLRGMYIDPERKVNSLREIERTMNALDKKFQRIMEEVFGFRLNWNSPTQLKRFFYDMLKVKVRKKRNSKGIFAPAVDREALESFQLYHFAKPFARFVLILRDLRKQSSFLKTEIDADGRMRTTYNLTGTNTGRLASSMSEFGTGTNVQNVNRKLRDPFVADPGMYMLNIDLEQADGRNIGAECWNRFLNRTRDEVTIIARRAGLIKENQEWEGPIGHELAAGYLDAAESADLHTTVCNMVWPELDWPDDQGEWKAFCDGLIAHGQDSYRQLSKKGGHGTNYYGTPPTMAKHLHTSRKVMEDFQTRYFGQFPAIRLFHYDVITEVEETGVITSLFGRRRHFWGRGNDAATHRKAIAYCGQSPTGEQIDRGLLQVWRAFPQVQLLNQVHDSILLQIPSAEKTELVPEILKIMSVSLKLKGDRNFVIPLDAAGGWNWGYAGKDNPYGLKGWKGKEERVAPNPRRRLKDYL